MKLEQLFIAGLGAFLPRPVSVHEAVADGRYDAREAEETRFESILVADGGESPPDMAVQAARGALARSGLEPEEIQLVLHASIYFQGIDLYSTASYIQHAALGAHSALALEVKGASNGGMASLELAASYLSAMPGHAAALVTTADKFSPPLIDRWRCDTGLVLADGATAMLLSRRKGFARVLSVTTVSDPSLEGLHRGEAPFAHVPGLVDVHQRKREYLKAVGLEDMLRRFRVGLTRFGYFRQVMLERLGMKPQGLRALDIGCGGGYLAEEFTRLGCRVSGIDPSPASIDAARAHARATGLDIDYRVGGGESIPYEDGTFDIVYCCDVLEHVRDLERVISETSRVLKPGGIYFFDTINRTWRSRLIEIKVLQEWSFTRVQPRGLHDWNMFIKPGELQAVLDRHALDNREMVGLKPRVSPFRLLRTLRGVQKGTVSYAEAGQRLNMGVTRDVSELYMGYALRDSSGTPARA